MIFEKSFFEKLNTISDWIIRIILINVLMIITSLPIITLYPSIAAGYDLLHHYSENRELNVFKGYAKFFMKHLKLKLILGFILFILIALGTYNVMYYVELLKTDEQLFYQIGYYIAFGFLVGIIVAAMYTISVIHVYPKLKVFSILKLSFYASGKYFIRTVILVLVNLIPFVLFLTPITMVIFIFAGVSTPLILNVLITRPVVTYLENLGEKHD